MHVLLTIIFWFIKFSIRIRWYKYNIQLPDVINTNNFLFLFLFYFRSSCECGPNGNGTQSTTSNPGRINANTTPMILASANVGASSSATTPCTCGNQMNSGNGGTAFNMNMNNGAYYDGLPANNADTILTSNAKFQAISAIAVSQDGVINVADQGKNFAPFSYSTPHYYILLMCI